MKIMLIGGTNFIGPVLAEQLSRAGHDIVLFHRKNTREIPFRQLQGDCGVVSELSRAVSAIDPEVVIHMTALFEAHVSALEQALDGRKTRVVILSSADVYKAYEVLVRLSDAPPVPLPLDEESPLRDVLYPYRGRLAADFSHDYEKILVECAAMQSPVIDAVILRLGMVYGKNDPNHRFREPVMLMRRGDKRIELPRQMAASRMCRCYVEDVAYGIGLAAEKGMPNEIYNLSALETPSEREWYERIAKLMEWDGEISVNQEAPPQGDANLAQDFIMDSSKIRRQLGYEDSTPIEQGLLNTIRWEIDDMNRRRTGSK
jgi:nucleoside-diphosphate-sugar epimerase